MELLRSALRNALSTLRNMLGGHAEEDAEEDAEQLTVEVRSIEKCIEDITDEFYRCISKGCEEQPSQCIVAPYLERGWRGEPQSTQVLYLGLCDACYAEYGGKLLNWCNRKCATCGYVAIGKYEADAMDGIPHKGHFFHELD